MMQLIKILIIPVLSLLLPVGDLLCATLDDQISEAGDGWTRFSYATRPGVGGDGDHIHISGDSVGDTDWLDGDHDGMAHLALRLRGGEVRRVKLRVGCRLSASWRDMRDLGEVPAAEAAAYMLRLARTAEEGVAEHAVAAAALADTTDIWPELVAIARDDQRPEEVREAAVFWLGQAAGEKVTRELAALVDDDDLELELREHAVFALSQSLAEDGVPTLSRIALENPHPQLRRSALFWLAQVDDPAVVDFFEEILTQ